jgi:GWxTD domain-containing protein
MRRHFSLLLFLVFFVTPALRAVGLPEMLQKAKEQFRLGSYSDTLATLDKLDAESQKSGFEKDRAALAPVLAFYRGASSAALGRNDEARRQFEIFLAFQPNAALDPAVYPKKVVAALDETRQGLKGRKLEPEQSGSLALAYRAFPRPNAPDDDTLSEVWADSPVRYLLSSEERRDFSRLSDPVSRSEFITHFWKARDPKPETADNEFREEFEKRVAFADSRFGQDETRGSLTDRGMVFLLLGPPTYIGRRPLATGEDSADPSGMSRFSRGEVAAVRRQPGGTSTEKAARIDRVTGPGNTVVDASDNYREVWHYRRELLPKGAPYQQVDFDFVTRKGYGKNVLQRESVSLHSLEVARRGAVLSNASK